MKVEPSVGWGVLHLMLHVDTAAGKSSPASAELIANLDRLAAHVDSDALCDLHSSKSYSWYFNDRGKRADIGGADER